MYGHLLMKPNVKFKKDFLYYVLYNCIEREWQCTEKNIVYDSKERKEYCIIRYLTISMIE